ncbi:hypothetical protein GCK32_009763 [Trichostrongylus colubriformis]|uniref:Uncharacterized protein n=1 Tax=Trichostrongylus colubriformis TaxID=6319 RepID=A0AAN8G4Z7_TRICO
MRTILLLSVLFCVFLSGFTGPDRLHKICVQVLKMDVKEVCELIKPFKYPFTYLEKEFCKYADEVIRKQKGGVTSDEICTSIGF